MLERAHHSLEKSGIRACLLRADVCSLPFRDDEMDMVMAALVLEHIAVPVEALREMVRVAGPNAPLLIIATRPHAPDMPFRLAFHYKPFPESLVVGWMSEARIRTVSIRPLSGIAGLFAQAYVGAKTESMISPRGVN
jgi:demethylmenaquinone methyltransferase/2-methoxy-6-polyprenyl-1,4-benzoquinol methylase